MTSSEHIGSWFMIRDLDETDASVTPGIRPSTVEQMCWEGRVAYRMDHEMLWTLRDGF